MILPTVPIRRCCEDGCTRPAAYFIDPATGRKPRIQLRHRQQMHISAGWCRLHYEMLHALAVRNSSLEDAADHNQITKGMVG